MRLIRGVEMINLSIIVPVYNVEKYIEKCISSILAYKGHDIEVIAVVDGSRDNSEMILRTYAQKDSRLRIVTQENKGVSTARNTGTEQAEGRYLMYVDADDWISADVLEKMLDRVKESGFTAQLLMADYIEAADDPENAGESEKTAAFAFEKNPSVTKIRELAVTSSKMNYCWGKFFDLGIIKDHHISFNRSIKVGEDAVFVMDYLQCIRDIEYFPQYLYYYRQNPTSVMSRVTVGRFQDMQATYEKRKELAGTLENKEMLLRRMNDYYKDAVNGALRQASKMQIPFPEKYRLVSSVLKMPFIDEILLSSCQSEIRRKAKAFLIKTNMMTFRILLKK